MPGIWDTRLTEVRSTKILVSAKNDSYAFDCEPREKILHAGLRRAIALPYECGTGTCGTCKAKLVEGDVHDGWPEAPGRSYLREAGEFLMCQSAPLADCAIEVSRVVEPMAVGCCAPDVLGAVVEQRVMLTHDVASLELAPERPLDFDAGQFMLMSAPGIAGSRAYSMVNFAPRAGRLVFVVKKKPGGRVSEWLFGAAVEGARVDLFGPLGGATFRPDMDKHLLCIAGGSGVAGMMSILSRATKDRYFERYRGDVFFGIRTRRDVFFLDELAGFQAEFPEALRVTIALSDEDVDPALEARYPLFGFGRGFVHAVAGERMKGRFNNVRAYAAGPPPMVDATLRMLLVQGKLKPDNIRYDKFS
ncbi:MAG TPA: 2Fe-2S iron-sulfur cluster binding domain-containing protein [Methylomirabilota bacterium]|nr:2Fe-2S iron-sulfur cluster binding domain-containing protein [Methylomirabilota bacterium]